MEKLSGLPRILDMTVENKAVVKAEADRGDLLSPPASF